MPTVMHTYTGQVVDVPEHILETELGRNVYIQVPEGSKPLIPGMFKPGNAEDFKITNKDHSDKEKSDKNKENEVSDVR